jgi:multisubunit Na+/H+ antiporter MnhB subunit
MKWAAILGITVVLVFMTIYEWPKMKVQMKREKIAFAVLTMLGGVLAFLLVFYPEMPGPTQWIAAIYKPLGKFLEK